MSLYSALYAGVSGLSAQSAAMATVADNITNINTVGYKGVEAQFRTLVTDGRAKANYSAGGVAAAPVALVSKQGLLQASGSSTDLAIDGGGFFVTKTSTGTDGDVAFTRAGSFKQDEQGFLRNTSGLYLQGWRLDETGEFNNTGSLDALEPVRLSDLTGTAAPTTRIQVRANLQSTVAQTDNFDKNLATSADFDKIVAAGNSKDEDSAFYPDFSRSFDVSDSQGGSHTLTMNYVKVGPNEWAATVSSADHDAASGIIAKGLLKFNPDGSLDRAASTKELFDPLELNWKPAGTIDSVPITLEIGDDKGINGITQFGSESALISSNVDGGMLGNLTAVEVGKDGKVSAIFDDGTTRAVFQLPIATFQNPDGLTRLSGNAYTLSKSSGGFTLNAPGSLGAGDIASNSLEASTVDLASEFTNMIRFQRAYSASSKIITTVDDMLREVSDLKR